MPSFEYNFPAIRGIQAGREYYSSMCPLRLIPRIFLFDEDELNPELRAQRILNKSRIPEMARYLLANPKSYIFSALTASIDGKVKFEALGESKEERTIGRLSVPMNARFIINDGQHRRAAIEAALRENPELGDETISVVFFMDVGLKRCQQYFADLNRHAIRPTKSLGILYDSREEDSITAKGLLATVSIFADLTELERSSISNRSLKLFTLSGIYSSTKTLLKGIDLPDVDAKIKLATEFWEAVAKHVPDWQLAKQRKASTAELRRDYIHAHTLALAALARVGNTMLVSGGKTWKSKLKKLESLDWSRKNNQWEGRAMNAGRLSKKTVNVTLSSNLIKKHLGVKLTAEEQQLEKDFKRNSSGKKQEKAA